MLRKRETAFGSSSARSITRSGSFGAPAPGGGGSARALQRPSSPRRAPNRASQSPSSPIGIASIGRSVPNASVANSGQPIASCTGPGASTSSMSGSSAATAAPRRSSSSVTKPRSPLIRPSGGLEIFAEQRLVERLGPFVDPTGVLETLPERVDRLRAAVLGRLQPSVEHELGEVAVLLNAAEDRADLADHQLEHRYLLVQQLQQLLLERVAGDEVEHEDLAALPDAIDAPDALLDRHRIPRHVEIDQGVAELDVAALAARLRAQEDRH